jgi:anti-sigma regulatory factor (Ser/Thr protein kinase)
MPDKSSRGLNGDNRHGALSSRPGSLRLSLAPEEGAPKRARMVLAELGADVDPGVCERGAIVLSELVTNAIKHGGLTQLQRIDVEVSVRPNVVRMEVTDPGSGFEIAALTPGGADGSGGWGLWLVDEMTDRWGVDFEHSTHIWCEFDTP